ncbi:hypothetical protein PAPYR_4657 [Paratrimastix pyriformis]|uniref:Uncharacterized protein n=1 Tax=Paratrimastix pyriformis TaxID=342808 RepID=A0ABQ8UJG9_9EUKA|nr:hypothetical protein PAPYR_4657 [Paratrimastix pyriformis]
MGFSRSNNSNGKKGVRKAMEKTTYVDRHSVRAPTQDRKTTRNIERSCSFPECKGHTPAGDPRMPIS